MSYPAAMDELPSWPRPHYQPGGGAPFLFYKLHGDFAAMPAISRSRYRTGGLPAGIDSYLITRDKAPGLFDLGLDERITSSLDPTLRAAIAAAPHAVIVRGQPATDDSLDYLRDTIGVVTAILEAGGVAMLDPQRFGWWAPAGWRAQVFEPARPRPWMHVVILVSDDETADAPGRRWVHTRGLRTFGRPDLSVRGVTDDELPVIQQLCNRFIELMALGAVVPEGQPVRMQALPGAWRCHHGGDLDDPDFNNVHLAIRREAP